MKRKILCVVLMAVFALPAFAAAEVNGVYLAPRFLLGIQDTGALSTTNNDDGAFKQNSQAVFGGALAVGFNFAPKFQIPIRTEVEFALRTNASHDRSGSILGTNWDSSMKTNLSTLFFNAYFDIETGTAFTPYVGAGLGMAFNHSEYEVEAFGNPRTSISKSRYDTTFAWNVGAGVNYAFTENVGVDLGYRFIGTGQSETKFSAADGDRAKIASSPYIHEFYLGGRFTF